MIKSSYSKHFSAIKMTILSLFAVSLLAGCGIRGPLQTPPPLFGGETTVDEKSRVPNKDLDQSTDDDDFIDLDVDDQDTLSDF